MKKIVSILTAIVFIIACTLPLNAGNPPKDSLKTEKTCTKSGDKKFTNTCDKKDCTKKCAKSDKATCCKDAKTVQSKKKNK